MLTQRSQYHKRMIKKYGVEIFVFPCDSEEQAFADEIQQIAQLRAEGYELVNRTDGGDGTSGYRHTDEAKAVMSKARDGVPSPFAGKKHTEKTKAVAKAAAKAQAAALTPEERSARATVATKARWARIPKDQRGVSAEVREKIAASKKGGGTWNKGVPATDEARAKMSESAKKKVMTAEQKAKIVATQKTPEMRAQQSAARKLWWANKRATEVKTVTATGQKKLATGSTEPTRNPLIRRIK